ncbi:MAG: sodium:alanine symporter family protein [Halobacteriovoraceae bacterium]|nr:sodium:alanine symporter family protein [Halobacteriovoraceae bacterium]
MLDKLFQISEQFAGLVWGLPMVYLLFGAGLIFTFYFLLPQFRYFKHAIDITVGKYDKPEDIGEITHFQALCAALSATIGLGNIAGVAVAITSGGPGAVFWMWVAGLLGMATKFSSITLALIYRTEGDHGQMHGGPMFTIKNALGGKFIPLAYLFAFSTIFGAIGAGNMFQSNQMASMISKSIGIPNIVTGLFFAALSAIVLIGGIKRIGNVAGKLVPVMVIIYFFGSIGIIIANIHSIPQLLVSIFSDAFSGTAAVGGFLGVGFKEVVIQGVRRAVFSNEAGLGSAAMAHSAAKSSPIQEGLVGMLGPFIDTIVVCTLTALVILITGVWSNPQGLQGAALTASAFSTLYGEAGNLMITLVVVLFAFSSIISWAYYGEQGVEFLFGHKYIGVYKIIFVIFVAIGAVTELNTIINFSDAFLGLMAIPNLTANIILAPKLKEQIKKYAADLRAGRI